MTLADLQTLAIPLLGLGIAYVVRRDWRDRGTAAEQMMNSPYPGNACRTPSGLLMTLGTAHIGRFLPQLAGGDKLTRRRRPLTRTTEGASGEHAIDNSPDLLWSANSSAVCLREGDYRRCFAVRIHAQQSERGAFASEQKSFAPGANRV